MFKKLSVGFMVKMYLFDEKRALNVRLLDREKEMRMSGCMKNMSKVVSWIDYMCWRVRFLSGGWRE